MNYSIFEPSIDPDQSLVDNEQKMVTRRSDLIRDHVLKNNLIPLNCDYFGMDSYYYNYTTKTMYKVCNVYNKYIDRGIEPNFEISTDYHILSLNNLIF